jgi:hypothetical protein
MTSDTFADWTSPRAFTLPDLGPGVDGALAQQVSAALRCLSADPARLAGSRWHVISEAARSGRVLAVAE